MFAASSLISFAHVHQEMPLKKDFTLIWRLCAGHVSLRKLLAADQWHSTGEDYEKGCWKKLCPMNVEVHNGHTQS